MEQQSGQKRTAFTALGPDARSKEKRIHSSHTGLVFAGATDDHRHPLRAHPERPERISAIRDHLTHSTPELYSRCVEIPVPEEDAVELDRRVHSVHSPFYLTRFRPTRLSRMDVQALMEEAAQFDSLYLNTGSGHAARKAATASLALTHALLDGTVRNGFAVVRPPGHHAEPCAAKGFCLINNVAVCAQTLVEHGERVAIVDWDVHHGNGTQTAFAHLTNPLYVSIHRHDSGAFFPASSTAKGSSHSLGAGGACMVGVKDGVGHTVNIAWSGPRAGDAEYLAAFDEIVLPILHEYSPTAILVSAGFDAAQGDRIGGCQVTADGFASMTQRLCQSVPSAQGRILMYLEGGYSLDVIPHCVAACVEALVQQEIIGGDPSSPLCIATSLSDVALDTSTLSERHPALSSGHLNALKATLHACAPYWKSLELLQENEYRSPTSAAAQLETQGEATSPGFVLG